MNRMLYALVAAAAIPTAALAHHGWSSYDETRTLNLTAPLSNVTWGNPHGAAQVRWQNKTWAVVLAPTSRMEARGLALAEINKGQKVTLTGYARRDGTAEMRIERIKVGQKTIELR